MILLFLNFFLNLFFKIVVIFTKQKERNKNPYLGHCKMMLPMGVNTSSLAIRISSVTLENTVGSMKKPFLPSPLPPHSSFAPSVMPL